MKIHTWCRDKTHRHDCCCRDW